MLILWGKEMRIIGGWAIGTRNQSLKIDLNLNKPVIPIVRPNLLDIPMNKLIYNLYLHLFPHIHIYKKIISSFMPRFA